MYKELIDYISRIALRHQAIKTVKYQSRQMINQQNNNAYMQVVIEDDVFSAFNISTNIYTMTINMDILTFLPTGYTPLEAHSDTFQVGNEILSFICKDTEYSHLINVSDYSFLTLSNFTDDNCYGQRLTITLEVPNPVNMCDLSANFTDEVPEVEEETLTIQNGDDCTNERFTTNLKKTITLKR